MAVAEVKRVELLVYRSALDQVMARLQDWGQMEISSSEQTQSEQVKAHLESNELLLGDIRSALRSLKPFYEDPNGGIGRMLGDRPTFNMQQLKATAQSVDVEGLLGQLREKERKLAELKTAQTNDRNLLQTLYGMTDLPVPLTLVHQGTDKVGAFLATGSPEALTDWKVDLLAAFGDDVDVKMGLPVGKSSQTPWALALFLRGNEDEVARMAAARGLSRYEMPHELSGSPKEEIERLRSHLDGLDRQIKEEEKQITEFARQNLGILQQMHDYYQALEDRRIAAERGQFTEQSVLLKGWVRSRCADELKEVLRPFDSEVDLTLRDPQGDERPPTALENPKFAQPLETLTTLYSAPQYGSPDPSLAMFPFFLLFFGLCYGDAGYGVIVTAIAGWVLLKYRRMAEGPKRFMKLILYSGILTILAGAAMGGWFGNSVESFGFLSWARPIVSKFQLINPMADPIKMLIFSLALGVVHLFVGLFIAMFHNLKKGDYLAAFADQGGWILLISGLLGLAVGSMYPMASKIGVPVAIVGAVVLVLTQGRSKPTLVGKVISGVLSLYNVTAYLGDLLSYSRLLALGLVGGVVAMIINLLSSMVSSTPYVGWLLAILLFVGGHVFSMVINILGAFVHPLRLQYVEFFGKFFETGGVMMQPLAHHPDYVNIGSSENDRP